MEKSRNRKIEKFGSLKMKISQIWKLSKPEVDKSKNENGESQEVKNRESSEIEKPKSYEG